MRTPSRVKLIEALLPEAEGDGAALLLIAGMMRGEGQAARAVETCERVLALPGVDAETVARARRFLSEGVPKWHFHIVRDTVRNAAYDAALRRAIQPGMRVLEIGTGTGVLAMMAARAGAAEVITCEIDPAIARAAADTIAANGYADRVRVLARDALAVTAADLGGPMDLLVSETISNDVLGEHVLPLHEHAMRNLLRPGAPVIPARAVARVALAEDISLDARRLGTIDGFDLSVFNRLAAPTRRIKVQDSRLEVRSSTADLFAFDLAVPEYCPPDGASVEIKATGGRINGIVQWLVLALDAETPYEAGPGAQPPCTWGLMFHALPEPIETRPGDRLRIHGAHDRFQITLWSD